MPDGQDQMLELPGFAIRHENWNTITQTSTIGRAILQPVKSYRLIKAATQIEVSAAARLLLVHLIGYLGVDDPSHPKSRFIVFPGNTRLSDELRCTTRSIQRQADELEKKGFLRRCYNGRNRRTGFDLTPFAMIHEGLIKERIALHEKRRAEREESQFEMSFPDDRVERRVSSMSPQGDTNVALNGKENNGIVPCARALDQLDLYSKEIATLAGDDSVDGDGVQDEAFVTITNQMKRGDKDALLNWASAVRQYGIARAVSLHRLAENDPRRRESTKRYFGWLYRTLREGNGDPIIAAAARAMRAIHGAAEEGPRAAPDEDIERPRTKKKAASNMPAAKTNKAEPVSHPSPTYEGPAPTPDRMRNALGAHVYDTWLGGCEISIGQSSIRLVADTAFKQHWIKSNIAKRLSESFGGIRIEVETYAGK